MKFLVLSDTHGKTENVEAIYHSLKGIDAVIHLGDYEKDADEHDRELIEKINGLHCNYFVPTYELPEGYNTQQPKKAQERCSRNSIPRAAGLAIICSAI